MLALAFALLLAAAPDATPEPGATRDPGIVYAGLGVEYRDGDGPRDHYLNPFIYPNAGITVDTPSLFLEANSPLPILLPDLVATLVVWLSTGKDDIPLWHAINGDKEPGGVRFGDVTARYPVVFGESAAIEVGATSSFTIVSVLIPQPGDEPDVRIPVQPRVVASSMGFSARLPAGAVFRGSWHAGNAWTHRATWNPVVGVGARSAMPFGKRVTVELRGDLAWNRLNLGGYRDPGTNQRVDGVGTDWYRFWSAEARLCYRWVPR